MVSCIYKTDQLRAVPVQQVPLKFCLLLPLFCKDIFNV